MRNAVNFAAGRRRGRNWRASRGRAGLLLYRGRRPGIAPEDIARIGRPFEQGDIVMANGMKGSGLGLAIANSLVELHGGTLHLASRSGEGAVAVVALPRVQRGPRAITLAEVA